MYMSNNRNKLYGVTDENGVSIIHSFITID